MSGSNKSLIKSKNDVGFVYKDLGKTFVFTAPYYSAGKHEIEVGKVLKGINRDKYTLATGIGLKKDRFGYISSEGCSKTS